jgi:4-hydroxy-3-polyprenylbenzoate decarboxylase
MPLVRWQFRGLAEEERKAFLFENVVDVKGKHYSMPVSVGTLAANTAIYALGLRCKPEEIHERWTRAQINPIAPVRVESGPVHEVVWRGKDLLNGHGLEALPVPISTPGFDNAPYLTSANWVSKDPETGIYNIGNYRGQIKGPTRVSGAFSNQHMGHHWKKCIAKGRPLEAAIVIGAIPNIAYAATAKLPYDFDEYRLAGGLAGEPVELVKCVTVDIEVPATAELVIEGVIPIDSVEPEGPFGEYTGYIGKRGLNPYMDVTCITHRRDAIYTALISQFPPSESSKIKHLGTEKVIYKYLRYDTGIPGVLDVAIHDEVSGSGQAYCVIKIKKTNSADVWRALHAANASSSNNAKICIAVDEDIDIRDPAMINWAICFNVIPDKDVAVAQGKTGGLDPSARPPGVPTTKALGTTMTALLIDATRPWPYPPVSLPRREFMERAKGIWEELELPALKPRTPWYGYSLGDWTEEDESEAEMALKGDHFITGEKAKQRRSRP